MFRTEISVNPFPFQLQPNQKVFTIGSCFSEVMGQYLEEAKFTVTNNPFGTLFNPISIFRLLHPQGWDEISMLAPLTHSGRFYHYDLHSEIHAPSTEELMDLAKLKWENAQHALDSSQLLLITLGSAWVYTFKDSGRVVANCHKRPAQHFVKRLLSLEEIKTSFAQLYPIVKQKNPHLKIVLTVSPVRHTRDTLPLNAVSKATLRLACHELCEHFPDVYYFPSYEILNDDLRDYRFYKADMIHPNEVAEAYIWDKFSAAIFSSDTQSLLQRWAELRKALAHQAFQPKSDTHRKFLLETLHKLETLNTLLPLDKEIEQVKIRLNN